MLRRPVPTIVVVAVAMAALSGACSSEDGRELPPPQADQTTTTATSAPSLDSTPSSGIVEIFTLYSTAFASGGPLPVEHTCDGADISPPLSWASTPPAAELAIIVRDPDADGFVHWLVTGIDPLVQGLGQGGLPEGAIEHVNDFEEARWRGPCPPEGSTHTYELTLYALPEPLVTSDLSVPSDEVVAQVEATATARAVLTATYGR